MKSGFLTSEFWLHLLALVAPALYAALVHSDNPTVVLAAQAAASVYTLSRSNLKKAAQDAAQAAVQVAAQTAVKAVADAVQQPVLPPFGAMTEAEKKAAQGK